MRIYFIHVYRRRWEFYPATDASHEIEPMSSDESQPGIVRWLVQQAADVRKAIDEADSGMKVRIRRTLERLQSRVDPTEQLLRKFRSAESVEILHPADVSSRFVQRKLRVLLLRKLGKHKRGIYINALCLPVSMAATLIPGPNVFFFWNAYRLVSHVLAYQGAERVLLGTKPVTFTPSADLESAHEHDRRHSGPLDAAVALRIAERLEIPGFVEYLRRTGGVAAAEESRPQS